MRLTPPSAPQGRGEAGALSFRCLYPCIPDEIALGLQPTLVAPLPVWFPLPLPVYHADAGPLLTQAIAHELRIILENGITPISTLQNPTGSTSCTFQVKYFE